jgi:hypothetical protein
MSHLPRHDQQSDRRLTLPLSDCIEVHGMNRFARIAAVAALAPVALVLASACSGDDSGEGSPAIEIVAAIQFIDGAGFHGIDESVNSERTIPATAASTARKAQAVVRLAPWPEELAHEAETLAQIFADLATELEKESPDLAVAGQLAARAHDGQHDFSAAVWRYLRTEAGQEVASAGSGHD